jgi:hypothetical protein
MTRILISTVVIALASSIIEGQTKRSAVRTDPRSVSASTLPAASLIPKGAVAGNAYTNKFLGFTLPLPDVWTIASDDFVFYMKRKGVDVSAKPPQAADLASQKKVDANFKRLSILVTAYRSLPGSPQNAMVRIAAEDVRRLETNRPVKDAVDYVDLMRSELGMVRMPASYKYSETQAEKLGPNQFAYLDTSDNEGKTRVYVTVRKGYAILFSLNYVADEDLETFRDVLARANFALK